VVFYFFRLAAPFPITNKVSYQCAAMPAWAVTALRDRDLGEVLLQGLDPGQKPFVLVP
jgi:hypothetical protein